MDNSFIVQSSPNLPNIIGSCTPHQSLTTHKLLKKAADYYQTILNYRNTPLEGLSLPAPAQLLIGNRLKTTLPNNCSTLSPTRLNRSEASPQKKERERKSVLRQALLHFTTVTISECRRERNGNRRQYCTSTSQPSHLLSRLLEVPDTTLIEGSYIKVKLHYKSSVESFATVSTDPTNQRQNSAGCKETANSETASNKNIAQDSDPPTASEEPCTLPIKPSPKPTL